MAIKLFSASRILRIASATTLIGGAYLMQPYRPVIFMGKSMTPTYQDHEVALATTDTSHLKRGDVVVLETPVGQIVKRVAYLPGDWIERFYAAGEWNDASVTLRKISERSRKRMHMTWTRVPDGFVYVLGDNPLVSVDSRQMGVFPTSSIRCVLMDPKPREPMTSQDFVYSE